jgi:hypothetical protein
MVLQMQEGGRCWLVVGLALHVVLQAWFKLLLLSLRKVGWAPQGRAKHTPFHTCCRTKGLPTASCLL